MSTTAVTENKKTIEVVAIVLCPSEPEIILFSVIALDKGLILNNYYCTADYLTAVLFI